MVNPATISMTGFASRRGAALGFTWVWELRSVNGKGLDLRLRVPDWVDGLEPALRVTLGKAVQRGSISVSLRLSREAGDDSVRVNRAGLAAALDALVTVQDTAARLGLELAPTSGAALLSMRGVLDQGGTEEDTGPLCAALIQDFAPLLADFNAMRKAEGAALGQILSEQIARIEDLTAAADVAAEARRPAVAAALKANLARVLDGAAEADPTRVAQELAMLAVKADVAEELDRLRAHITAARALLADPGAVGRKLDFLIQEFLREANTLCSKAGDAQLTQIGLDLKHVIDQMREQVQNVE